MNICRPQSEAEIPLENHNFALYWSLPCVKHNVLSVLEQGTHVELVLGDTPESDT
jgi:hypothetical protein